MVTLLAGIVGGLLGALAAGGVVLATGEEPGPPAVVWAMYLGDGDPARYATAGAAVHLAYGALAGAVFAGVLASAPATLADGLLRGIAWAAVLGVVAVGFWLEVAIGARPDLEGLARLAGAHLAYGVVLGLVVGVVPGL